MASGGRWREGLVTHAQALRSFERDLDESPPAEDAFVRVWFVRPSKRLVIFLGLLATTTAAAVVHPRLLYVLDGNETYADRGQQSPFMGYRVVLVLTFATCDAIGLGVGASATNVNLGFGDFVWTQVAYFTGAFAAALSMATGVWICSRIAFAPVKFGQAMQIAGYSYVAAAVFLGFAIVVCVALLRLLDPWIVLHPRVATLVILPLALLALYWLVEITFVAPLSALNPEIARGRIRLGWFAACGLAVIVYLLVFVLVLAVLKFLGITYETLLGLLGFGSG